MVLFRRLLFSVFFGVLLCMISLSNFASAQGTINQLYQPTPQILSPPANSTLTNIIVVHVYVPQAVVQKVEIYANSVFLGLAQPQSSSNLSLNWDTRMLPNGQYNLMARVTVVMTSGYPIDTFSPTVPVTIKNVVPVVQKPTNVVSGGGSQTTTDQETATSQESQASIPTTTPKPSSKVTQANTSTNQTLLAESKSWQQVAKIEFPKVSDNQLTTIQYKIDSHKAEYLIFSGVATPNSQVGLTIFSQPIVITEKADSSGNWEYVFEKPLEPGKHQITVEIIKPTGEKVSSGPFSFLIARAQATSNNPTGASLQLVDPTKKMYLYYYLIAAGLVTIAFIALIVILWRRKKKGVNVKV